MNKENVQHLEKQLKNLISIFPKGNLTEKREELIAIVFTQYNELTKKPKHLVKLYEKAHKAIELRRKRDNVGKLLNAGLEGKNLKLVREHFGRLVNGKLVYSFKLLHDTINKYDFDYESNLAQLTQQYNEFFNLAEATKFVSWLFRLFAVSQSGDNYETENNTISTITSKLQAAKRFSLESLVRSRLNKGVTLSDIHFVAYKPRKEV